MAHLPSEVVAEILARLPVKSVLRFRPVCNTWLSIIDAPQFVSMHLTRTAQSNLVPSLLFVPDDSHALYIIEPEYQHYPNSLSFKSSKINFPGFRKGEMCSICSVDGLLCVTSIDCDDIYTRICNPATGFFVDLPVVDMALPYTYETKFISSAFSFDGSTGHYKVVHTKSDYCSEEDEMKGRHFVYSFARKESQVFVPGSNSWRLLSTTTNGSFVGSTVAAVNNLLHWLIKDDYYILRFDLGTETFGSIELPHDSDFEEKLYEYDLQIMNLDGCLCLADEYRGHSYEQELEMWIMKDYNVHQSWTKFVISIDPPYFNSSFLPISFWKKDELLLLHDSSIFTLYNIYNEENTGRHFDEIPELKANRNRCIYEVHPYTGNLLKLQDTGNLLQLEDTLETWKISP